MRNTKFILSEININNLSNILNLKEMKKTRLFLTAVIAVFFMNAFSQTTTVDLGVDWDPNTKAEAAATSSDPDAYPAGVSVDAASGVYFEEATTSYAVPAANPLVNFSLNLSAASSISSASRNQVYINNPEAGDIWTAIQRIPTAFRHVEFKTETTPYLEGAVVGNYEINGLKFNGTTSSKDNAMDNVVLYSDKIPFDAASITGYDLVHFAVLRNGDGGTTLSNTIPAETKSFRLYRTVRIADSETEGYSEIVAEGGTSLGSTKASLRVAYVSVSVTAKITTSINDNSSVNKTVVKKLYYDLSGRQVAESAAKGILIQKSIFDDGSDSYEKVFISK